MSQLFLVIDESGHLHPNSPGRYFVIGGYLTEKPSKINKKYKNAVNKLKRIKGLDVKSELKGSEITHKDKRFLLSEINKIDDVIYVFSIIDKKHVKKEKIEHINLFYNYSVGLLIECLVNRGMIDKNIKNLKIKADNRTIKHGSINGLADYVNTKLIIEKSIPNIFKTSCEYLESHENIGIQVADLLCNVLWAKFNYPDSDGSSKKLEDNEVFYCKIPYSKFQG